MPVVACRGILLVSKEPNAGRTTATQVVRTCLRRAPNLLVGGYIRSGAWPYQAVTGYWTPIQGCLESRTARHGQSFSTHIPALWKSQRRHTTHHRSHTTLHAARDGREGQQDSLDYRNSTAVNHRVSHLFQHPLMKSCKILYKISHHVSLPPETQYACHHNYNASSWKWILCWPVNTAPISAKDRHVSERTHRLARLQALRTYRSQRAHRGLPDAAPTAAVSFTLDLQCDINVPCC